MEKTDGVEEVDDGLSNMINTFVITVDKEKAAKYGLTVAQVFAGISTKLASTRSTTSVETDLKSYDVFVRTDEQAEQLFQNAVRSAVYVQQSAEQPVPEGIRADVQAEALPNGQPVPVRSN